MRAVLALLLLLAPAAQAQTLDCTDRSALPQIALTECAARDAAFWDNLLNNAYQQVIAELAPDRVEGLRTAQRAWITYRDLTCEMEADRYRGGSIAPMIRQGCIARLTERRARDLETYLNP